MCVCVYVLEFDSVSYVFDAVRGLDLTLMRHFTFQIHHNNINNGPALIFVGCMYETGVVLALDKQLVRA